MRLPRIRIRSETDSHFIRRSDLWCSRCGFLSEKEGLNFCSSCGSRLNAPPIDPDSRRYIEALTKRELRDLSEEKDLVVREVRQEALDKTISSIKNWSWIVGVPIGFLLIVFAVWGIKDAYTFLGLIEPRIKQAQERINYQNDRINETQSKIDAQASQIATNGYKITSQENILSSFDVRLKALIDKVAQQEIALQAVNQKAAAFTQKQDTNALQAAYPFTVKGPEYVDVNYVPLTPLNVTPKNPLVYLILPQIDNAYDFDNVDAFSRQIKMEGFQQLVGTITLKKGRTDYGVTLATQPANCSQIIYFDRQYQNAAEQLAKDSSLIFKVPYIKPKLTLLNKASFGDAVSVDAIQLSKLSVVIVVSSQDEAYCPARNPAPSSSEVRH